MATFRDLMTECLMYNHSAEHFDLMKECSELTLTCKFIEDQQFMAENAAEINSGIVTFTEGYLQESYDESTLEVLVEKAASKGFGIKQKIYNGFMKICKSFMSFLRKITVNFDKLTNNAQHCKDKLKSLTLTDEDINEIQGIVNKAKSANGAFPVRANQPYLSHIKLGGYNTGDQSITILKNDLAAALSNETVVADCTKSSTIVLSCEDIVDVSATICLNFKTLNIAKIKGIVTTLAKSAKKNVTKGLAIAVDTKLINKQADMLQKIMDELNEVGRSLSDAAGDVIDAGKEVVKAVNPVSRIDDNDIDELADKMKDLTHCYTMITQAVGVSMKMYTSLNTYRADVINPLKKYLDSKK